MKLLNMGMNMVACLAVISLTAGCTAYSKSVELKSNTHTATINAVTAFSNSPPAGLPLGWNPVILTRAKKLTTYQLVQVDGQTVLHAHASSAASVLMQTVNIDPMQRPLLQWKWRVDALLERSDNFVREAEDSPVRIVLAFDGDKDNLPFADQMTLEAGKLISGVEPPYATLMYIWERNAPVGTVILNSRSNRVRKVVAVSGKADVGHWKTYQRNIIDDFEKAFGEKPGKLIGIGVMTDTDNTGETIEAWYGDIGLERLPG